MSYYIHILGIEYGAEAYFIFEKATDESTSREQAYGNLELSINKIPSVSISGHGSLNMSNELREHAKGLHVKFHGDFVLTNNPTTFEEAVKIYKELPNLMKGQNAQSVPMTIYLYPLNKIGESKSFRIVRDICKSLVDDVAEVIQDLDSSLEDAQDMAQSTVAEHFSVFRQRVVRFADAVNEYKRRFQSQIAPLIVEIRGRGKRESELTEKLGDHYTSPFSQERLENWLQEHRAESATLKTFIMALDRDVEFCKDSGEFFQHVMSSR